MNRALAKSGAVLVMGIVLLSNQGCSTKWPKPEGQHGSGSAGTKLPTLSGGDSSGNTRLPTISGEHSSGDTELPNRSEGSSNGELSGFSRNPSEERIAPAEYSGVPSLPSRVDPRQRAELTKEEKAAVEAGLQDVFFGYDQWTLSDAGMKALNHDAAYLKSHPAAVLKIEGHCDERGTAAYNVALGDRRAKAALDYLVAHGIAAQRITIVSYGEERPVCTEHTEACWAKNRRAHFLVKKG